MNIFSYLIKPHGNFPNNDRLPVMLYKQALPSCQPDAIEQRLIANGWKNPWRDSIYPYHHYHSNTHEVLVIYSGSCDVQLGGDDGQRLTVKQGDVLIFQWVWLIKISNPPITLNVLVVILKI